MIIAIDGPAGAGKSTIAKMVAKCLDFLYIDTGAMYRALTVKVLAQGLKINDRHGIIDLAQTSTINLVNTPEEIMRVLLDGRDVSIEIRQPQVTKYVSDIARIKEVREVMVELQRQLGKKGNVVLDGRDIGTVVFPDAKKKFYLDADFKERVNRRLKELQLIGTPVTFEDVAADLKNRDTIDSTREVAPLKKADDAISIDTTSMSIEAVVEKVLLHIQDGTLL
ncbi:MAG: (d)CMP kinase [Candidatus Omnitrophica bacterium]|nr:(d)CMP kinase [Candidatus Omnitrophota bacterium]